MIDVFHLSTIQPSILDIRASKVCLPYLANLLFTISISAMPTAPCYFDVLSSFQDTVWISRYARGSLILRRPEEGAYAPQAPSSLSTKSLSPALCDPLMEKQSKNI